MTSAINPNNIDGSYPIAGQDNSSQGFRDNFTNIKVNFQAAEDEINDLQSKVLLKAALTGSAGLDNNMNDALLYAAKIQDFAATKVTVTPSGAPLTATINYAAGHYQSFETTGSTTLAFLGWPPASPASYGYLKVQISITNTAHTITLPGSVTLGTQGLQGYSAGVITFSSTGTYEFGFGSYDGGTTVTIFDLNRALTNFSGADLSIDDVNATGFVSAVGNVTGGNIRTAGTVSATGNVIGSVHTGLGVNVTGNIVGGNVTTVGLVSATGNVTGGNINGFVSPTVGTASRAPVQFASGSLLTVPAAGAFEYDGVVFYTTPTSVEQRGISPSVHVMCLASNYIANDSASAQKVFNAGTGAAGTITLSATTTYEFEGVYYITRSVGTNSHTLGTLFAFSNAPFSLAYTTDALSSAAGVIATSTRAYSTAATSLTVTNASTAANEHIVVELKGIIRTNLSTTCQPQMQYSSAPGGAPTVLTNSYIKFTPIGNSSVTSVGAW
jgi:hypothetical protein